MSDVNKWLLSLPEDERRFLLGLDKWRLADKAWDAALEEAVKLFADKTKLIQPAYVIQVIRELKGEP